MPLPLFYNSGAEGLQQQPIPPKVTQADWYVDWVNGNDANPGTLAKPVKTVMNGVVAQWGSMSPQLMQNTTLHIVSAQPVGAEDILLGPIFCNGFGFSIVQVPPVAGDPQLLASGRLLGAVTAKNRATAVKLQVTLDKPYPNGSIVQNTTHPSSATIQSMAGNVATMCQPINGFTTEVDTWAMNDVVNVIAPTVLNIQSLALTNMHFSNLSQLLNIRIPDSTGTPGSRNILIGTNTGTLLSQHCAIEANLLVPLGQNGFVFFIDCWTHPTSRQNIVGPVELLGGSWSPTFSAINNGNFPFSACDLDTYLIAPYGQFWCALANISGGNAQANDGQTFFMRVNFAGCTIWGTSAIDVQRGGRLINHAGASWTATILLTAANPIQIDGQGVANNVNPTTGVISAQGPLSLANLDANGSYMNLALGTWAGIW
jgi:hypothetical protein